MELLTLAKEDFSERVISRGNKDCVLGLSLLVLVYCLTDTLILTRGTPTVCSSAGIRVDPLV